jgi:hypothetical protein
MEYYPLDAITIITGDQIMTITWVDQKFLTNLIEENSQLIKEKINYEKHVNNLREHIEGLEEMIYPNNILKSPNIIDLPPDNRETLSIAFSIGQYKSPKGDHIIVREHNHEQICYKYYIDNCSVESKYYIEILKHFFNDLLQKYGD